MQHPHRVVRAYAADLCAGFMGHRARPCAVCDLDDKRGGRADVDVYLRAVTEIDDLRHDAANDVAARSDWLTRLLQDGVDIWARAMRDWAAAMERGSGIAGPRRPAQKSKPPASTSLP